jgi:hypothetical protein
MQHITIESSVGQKLVEALEQAVVCDEQGRVLGLFSPILGRPDIGDLQLEPPLSIAQTEELRKNQTGKTLEEILKLLGY